MQVVIPGLTACLCLVASGTCFAGGEVMGYWPFDGSLNDASGAGRHGKAEGPKFVEGRKGQALAAEWKPVEVASAPELQLSPGLMVDCWVYFDQKPEGWEQIVYREKEYQLRVDDGREGGRFSFFVYLNGWEPRVSGPVPEAGRWHHLVAQWTGTTLSLTVDGQKSSTPRSGAPVPTEDPLRIGGMKGRLDELTISNPGLAQRERLAEASRAIPDAERLRQASFGREAGWTGWRADLGATVSVADSAVKAGFPTPAALIVNPGLAIDVNQRGCVSLELESTTAKSGTLVFLTDRGQGVVPFTVWGGGRASIVDLSPLPAWSGMLRVLGLAFPENGPHDVAVRSLWVSERPEGRPFLYVRNLAPGRAIVRAGREEKIIAIVRNLGADARNVCAQLDPARLARVVGPTAQAIPSLEHDGTARFEWRLRADAPATGTAHVAISADGCPEARATLHVDLRPSQNLPKADYVPPPVPAKTPYLTLVHYCPLWKVGTHYGWGKIEPWPERRPAIGWYDEGTPEVADWHIKYALEHGIQGFIYCWYRADFSPEIHQSLGHAIHDGMLKARYLDRFKFCIMWENGCALGVKSREDMMQNLLPYWIRSYFKHPSYVRIDNKPVLFVWQPGRVSPELGGSEATRKVLDEMREACKQEGFDGLYIIGCVGGADEHLLRQMAAEGWDASSAYGIGGPVKAEPGRDVEGIATTPYGPWLDAMKEAWLGKKRIGALPDIVDVMMGWDPRPWHEKNTSSYVAGAQAEAFRAACVEARRVVDATPGNGLDKRVVVFDNWDEFGEGHYLEPTSGFGFSFVDAIRDVFCEKTGPHVDITPEDVGLEPPEHVYLKQKEILGEGPGRERKITDNLVAWWAFEEDDDTFAQDSSSCGFTAMKSGFVSTQGVKGKGFLCQGGSVSCMPNDFFFSRNGITVDLWFKTDVADQSDHWMVNTIGAANTGYRLGLVDGKLVWQVPQKEWSHLLACPDKAPLGQWTHVAATYDNRTMRLYLNGEEKASLERGGAIIPSGAMICLGSYGPGNAAAAFSGVLDEVRIYNRALTADEIRERAHP